MHRAFDRGLIAISDEYRVMVSTHFTENSHTAFSLKQFEGRKLFLPREERHWPSQEFLEWHRERGQ